MTKRSRKTLMIWALSALPLVVTAVAYSFLPEEIPVFWNFHGTVLRYSEKNSIWLLASFAAVFAVLFTVLPLIDPRGKNYQRFMEYYETFTLVMVVAVNILTGVVISESFRPGQIEVGQIVVLMIGLICMVWGNLMPKIKSNYFIGIRTPWTLSDPDIWNRTHRIGGRIFFIFGLCVAVWALMPVWRLLIYLVSGLGLVAITIVPYVYSYWCFRQSKKKAAATEEE